MTIFQKMLAVPVLALFLFSGFLLYSYFEYQQTSTKVEEIRDHYLPLLEIANDNNHIFREIRSNFKDAVLAGEPSWLPNANLQKQKIEANIALLKKNPRLVDVESLTLLHQSFEQYYRNAYALAKSILNNQDSLLDEQSLIQNVETYHNTTHKQFMLLKKNIQTSFRQTVDDTNKVMNKLLFVGAVMSITIMLFLLGVTLAVSLSTRHSVNQIIGRMKSLAMGNTDFSGRIQRKNKDELGYLIHWFNKLSDKLEQDYMLLETISITDKLTQLNNRSRTDSYFPQALADANTSGNALAIIILDIDHFKHVNDTYGHLIGDEVLKCFANILKKQAKKHDFIARWGGEEFVIILPDSSTNKARQYAENIRLQILAHHFNDVGQVSASFGVALSTYKDDTSSLIKRADDCLYQAKNQGRNCVVVAKDT